MAIKLKRYGGFKLPQTPLRDAFYKQIKRLRAAIRREYRKTGIELDEDLIPKMPERVTKKRLEEIKNIKPKDLRKGTEFVDTETGEKIDYETYKKQLEEQRQWEDEDQEFYDWDTSVIDRFRDTYSRFNDQFQDAMDNWLYNLIDNPDIGRHRVAEMLQAGMEDSHYITYQVAYDEGRRLEYISKMLSYMPQISRSEKRLLMDAVESEETGFDIE